MSITYWSNELESAYKEIQRLRSEIDRLSSPPEERRDIAERQKTRHELEGCGYAIEGLEDIDTLLQDLRKYENAHTILLGERDAAREKCEELQHRHSQRDAADRAAGVRLHAHMQAMQELTGKCERLEAALRKINAGPHHSLDNGEVANCFINGHIYGSQQKCIFCGCTTGGSQPLMELRAIALSALNDPIDPKTPMHDRDLVVQAEVLLKLIDHYIDTHRAVAVGQEAQKS